MSALALTSFVAIGLMAKQLPALKPPRKPPKSGADPPDSEGGKHVGDDSGVGVVAYSARLTASIRAEETKRAAGASSGAASALVCDPFAAALAGDVQPNHTHFVFRKFQAPHASKLAEASSATSAFGATPPLKALAAVSPFLLPAGRRVPSLTHVRFRSRSV
jgi:hypothetical protein